MGTALTYSTPSTIFPQIGGSTVPVGSAATSTSAWYSSLTPS